MLTGSLLSHRRRRPNQGRGQIYIPNGEYSSAIHHRFTPEGLTRSRASGRVSQSCSTNSLENSHPSTPTSPGPAMPGLNTAVAPVSDRVSFPPHPTASLPVYMSLSLETEAQMNKVLNEFVLSDDTLKKIMALMNNEMDKGLDPATHEEADIKMFPTFVRSVPDGSEHGDFLALDLGGTNFRVLWVHIPEEDSGSTEKQEIKMKSRIVVIPVKLMKGPGEDLFDHIVKGLASFMEKEKLIGKSLPLGFTFSFPVKQEGLDRGRLVTWTKGFTCGGVVGEDVVGLLHEAIQRHAKAVEAHRGIENVKCVAIVNDTTGTLMACAHKNPRCLVGLILGTGSNACYVEKLDKVKTWTGDKDPPDEVLINTEWGAFGNGGCLEFIQTEFDKDVDAHSPNARQQIFEKMISGMYMGEIVRLVMCKLFAKGVLFSHHRDSKTQFFVPESPTTSGAPTPGALAPGSSETKLAEPEMLNWGNKGTFFTKYISEIEGDCTEDFVVTREILKECGVTGPTLQDCAIVKKICDVVSVRAANLSSLGIAVILNRMQRPHATVGIDGSLYRFHPRFHTLMMNKIPDLILPSLTFDLTLSQDGSGKGAALIAAVVNKKRNPSGQSQT